MDRDKKRKLLAIRNSERKKGNYNSYAEIFDKKNSEVEKDFPKDPDNITKNELHEHFDLDRDGTVTLDEYAEHINYHCKNPDVLEDEMQQADFERGFKYETGGIIIPFENIVHIKRPRRSRKISGDLESGAKLPKIVYYLKDKTKFDDFNDDDIYSAEFVEEIKGKGVRVMRDTDFAKGGLISKRIRKGLYEISYKGYKFFCEDLKGEVEGTLTWHIGEINQGETWFSKRGVDALWHTKTEAISMIKDTVDRQLDGEFDEAGFAKGGYIPYVDVRRFEDYTKEFYGKKGIYANDYDGGFTDDEIVEAISDYIKDDNTEWGGGDSVDRELMRDRYLIPSKYPNRKTEFKKGGKTKEAKTWKEKYNKKYGHDLDEGHSLAEIAKETGVSKKGIQQIYNKGVGAWKNNLGSVRLKGSFKKNKNTKKFPRSKRLGKEQWAKARVYSAVMGGKAAKVDAKELKMMEGGELFAPSTYMYGKKVDLIHIYNEDESRNWQDNAQYMIDHYNKMGIKSGVVHKGKLHGFYVEQGMFEKGGEMMTGIRTPEIVEFEDGGDVDLFEHYQKLPPKARDIVDRYMKKYEEGDYNYSDSKKFLEEMENVGYTFEYGLDNEPYDLRKMAKGGLTPAKAKKMLKDGTAQGKPLTDKQKRYFGAIAGGKVDKVRERARMERGGKLKMNKSKESKDYQLDYLYHQLELSKEKMENSKSDKEINTNTVRYNTIKKMIDNKLT